RLLSKATRPAIIAGGGVRRSGKAAQEYLQNLAEMLQAPVICTPGGNSAFPYDHPLSLGGWIEARYVTELLDDADVLFAVGHSLCEVTSNYYTMAPRCEIIQIDAQVQVLESNFSSLGIRSDAGVALQQIIDDIRSHEPVTNTDWHGKTAEQIVQHLKHQIAGRLAGQDLEHEQHVMTAIRNAVSDDAV